jgi:hypothetical protein
MVEDDPGHWHKMINKGFDAAGTSVHYTGRAGCESCWGLSRVWLKTRFYFCLLLTGA